MSALPSKAEICDAKTNVRFVPVADTDHLFAKLKPLILSEEARRSLAVRQFHSSVPSLHSQSGPPEILP